jgi:AcrR family transcriptional regulator
MLSGVSQRDENKRRTRGVLLDAAREVIGRKGFAATTARDVAGQAGVAVGTVFVHFPTMAALAETLLDETIGEALTSAAGSRPGAADIVEQFVHVCVALFDAYETDPALARDVLAASLFHGAPGGPSHVRMAAFRDWVVAEVDAAVATGQIRPTDSEEAFFSFFSLYFGTLVAGLRGDLDRPAQLSLLRSSLRRQFGVRGKES